MVTFWMTQTNSSFITKFDWDVDFKSMHKHDSLSKYVSLSIVSCNSDRFFIFPIWNNLANTKISKNKSKGIDPRIWKYAVHIVEIRLEG